MHNNSEEFNYIKIKHSYDFTNREEFINRIMIDMESYIKNPLESVFNIDMFLSVLQDFINFELPEIDFKYIPKFTEMNNDIDYVYTTYYNIIKRFLLNYHSVKDNTWIKSFINRIFMSLHLTLINGEK